MKTVLKIKLNPTPQQHADLLETIKRVNAACNYNYIAGVAYEKRVAGKFKLQKLVYK